MAGEVAIIGTLEVHAEYSAVGADQPVLSVVGCPGFGSIQNLCDVAPVDVMSLLAEAEGADRKWLGGACTRLKNLAMSVTEFHFKLVELVWGA